LQEFRRSLFVARCSLFLFAIAFDTLIATGEQATPNIAL
jgi:hypothetical protein